MTVPIIVIPTYWRNGDLKNHDTVYDHPTDLLNPEETITRTLDSISKLEDDFDVLIIGVPTNPSFNNELDDYLIKLLKKKKWNLNLQYFGANNFNKLQDYIQSNNHVSFLDLISNSGYGNVRNLGIFISHILNYNILIFIDDDELITDRNFVNKATEFLGTEIDGKTLLLKIGLYRNEDHSIFVDESNVPWWEFFWNKPKLMNKTFKQIDFNSENRLIDTPIAFGGNMVITKDCWLEIPFDPYIKRGEDMDYLRNAKYFNIHVMLDKQLFIIHKPPHSKTDYEIRFHEDFYRFLYAKMKIENMGISSSDYDPYPGYFLNKTEGKILLTEHLYNIFHNQDILLETRTREELMEKLTNMKTVFNEVESFAQKKGQSYVEFQKRWKIFLKNSFKNIPKQITTIIHKI